jgi:hypothetical protein
MFLIRRRLFCGATDFCWASYASITFHIRGAYAVTALAFARIAGAGHGFFALVAVRFAFLHHGFA